MTQSKLTNLKNQVKSGGEKLLGSHKELAQSILNDAAIICTTLSGR